MILKLQWRLIYLVLAILSVGAAGAVKSFSQPEEINLITRSAAPEL